MRRVKRRLGLGFAFKRRNRFNVCPSEPATPFEKPAFTGSFYFNTDEIDALWAELKDKANVAYGIENFEYGMREFAVYDNNGYLLQFGQELEN